MSDAFIRRPIATSLIMLAIALFGVMAYRGLPVSDLPNVDFPTLVVSASLPGANPETMASSVATPLERQFSTISGLDSMSSTSAMGTTQITLQFDLGKRLDSAAVDVETAIAQATPLLPPGMPNPPVFRKYNPADQPVLYLVLTSGQIPLYKLNEYADTVIGQRISMINGVAQVQLLGTQKYAVHVQLDPHKLATRQIGVNEIERALATNNVNMPTGTLYGPHQALTVLASGQLMNADAFRPTIVAYRNGAPVRLGEIANVIDSVEDDKTASWYYTRTTTERSITMTVMRQPGTNTIEVADAIKALLPVFRAQIPPSVNLGVRIDRAKSIREAFHDIEFTMALTLGLVVMVIFLFLRNVSATAIPSLALPFSIIGTFSVMYLMKFNLDNLSLMALILSVGFVVDDAIVMLENIVRHMERGEAPLEAALNGSREIGFTIVSMTLSLAAVFIPVLFMGGILGRLFREFAVTICSAILISGFVSLTLTPMLASRFLRPMSQQSRGWFYRATERMFERMHAGYGWSLRRVLRYRLVMIFLFFAILGGTALLFVTVPKGFIPEQDNDVLYCTTEAAQGTSYYQMVKYQKAMAEIMRQDPNIDSYSSSCGGSTSSSVGGSNMGRMYVQLKPRRARALSVSQVIEELRPKLSRFPGMRIIMQNPPAIRMGSFSKGLYQYTLQGPDTHELYRAAQIAERDLATLPQLQDVSSDLQLKNPQVTVQIDRDKAAALRVNARTIESALYSAYGPRWVSTIYSPINQYRVLLELKPEYQTRPDAVSLLYLKSQDGQRVPLDTVTTRRMETGPQTINHFGQLPAVTVSFNLKPGYSLGDAVAAVEDLAAKKLPATINATFQGTAKAFQSSLTNLALLLAIAIAVVYIVLGVLYESYIHPLTILSGLPSAGFGALLTLYIFKVDLSVYAFVGLIMLIGIVKKNAIMQIDFALEAERKEGKDPTEAIYEGCMIRFRPIMMTSMSALLGAVPIALGFGSGGEARQPLGLVVVGGLLFSQSMTLYLTPVVYTYMAGIGGFGDGVLNPRLRSAQSRIDYSVPEAAPEEQGGQAVKK